MIIGSWAKATVVLRNTGSISAAWSKAMSTFVSCLSVQACPSRASIYSVVLFFQDLFLSDGNWIWCLMRLRQSFSHWVFILSLFLIYKQWHALLCLLLTFSLVTFPFQPFRGTLMTRAIGGVVNDITAAAGLFHLISRWKPYPIFCFHLLSSTQLRSTFFFSSDF